MKKRFLVYIFLICALLIGCANTTQGGKVGVKRSQFLLADEEALEKQASTSYNQYLQAASQKGILNKNMSETKRVRRIANNLIAQVGAFRQDALSWDWRVNVINEPVLNAFCMPGGKIIVFDGIINKLHLSDAELAAVIGHEMAHALREHSREQASIDGMKNLGISLLGAIFGLGELGQTAGNAVATYAVSMPFSRSHETEADTIGVELMARAGYDPNAAITLWKKMQQMNKDSGSTDFFSTHPSDEKRIENLKVIAKEVMPLYKKH